MPVLKSRLDKILSAKFILEFAYCWTLCATIRTEHRWISEGDGLSWGLSLLSGLYQLFVTLLIQLVREVLHLSGKSQGKVIEFQKPLTLATMLEWLQPLFSLTVVLFFPLSLFSCKRLVNAWCGRRSLYVLRPLEYTKTSVIDINVWIYTYKYRQRRNCPQ